ncbi:MAG: RagB/SusD family nutrient uptake outer membrane protein [Capnocytophaga sp.]|jgi:putative outer membrane protein, probably involved in nutrient binding|nr:MAG: RagB/SusD family nutrient uptake outer membrane protein [Capnocytophaga sp.]
MKKNIYHLALIVSFILFSSCSKEFTETQFFQEDRADEGISSVEQLSSLLRGAYVSMRDANYLGCNYRAYAEIRSDEMHYLFNSPSLTEVATYTLSGQDAYGPTEFTWKTIYQVVASANIVINAPDDLPWGEGNTPQERTNEIKKLKAQAYTVRALAFFDLLRLYGQKYAGGTLGVVLPTRYDANAHSTRATIPQTESQIETDFQKAIELFEQVAHSQGVPLENLVDTDHRNYISPLAVKALQSRYYLYKNEWTRAAGCALDVIFSGIYQSASASELKSSFQKANAPNSIFELTVGINGTLSTQSYDYLINSKGSGEMAVSRQAQQLYEPGDVRASLIETDDIIGIDMYFLNDKFSDLEGNSNIKVIRYEEVLLNAIEALLHSGDDETALTLYNELRGQRGLSEVTSVSLDELKKERVRELLGEGFRYWDLLRWGDTVPQGNIDGSFSPSNNKTVPNRLFAFPIPQTERMSPNSKGVQQNEGY